MSCKRRRTEIAEIGNKSAKNVTFTKRRQGLFNKASELEVLCGARVGILTFSPAGKPYPFGEDVVSDYFTWWGPPSSGSEFDTIVKWIESAPDGSCETVEELESLIREYESLQQAVARRLEGGLMAAMSSSSGGGAFSGHRRCCTMNSEFGSSIPTNSTSTLLDPSVPLQYRPESVTHEPQTAADTPIPTNSMSSLLDPSVPLQYSPEFVANSMSTLLNPSIPLQYGPESVTYEPQTVASTPVPSLGLTETEVESWVNLLLRLGED
ncbi:myocyte-specific enhancer factor 2D-like [Punica granatum]|uniref:Myocyte-specific enhancer factor 2D-like n=2 Tax=Punica granatum TaxID=22663 RepID=A0A6P8E281_PUNGR|nr:myocyte-specific enhancer factor 2D-like [Punica granatum]PKI33914.1 hypothetical protein CRG98_045696 [Punica granatum]